MKRVIYIVINLAVVVFSFIIYIGGIEPKLNRLIISDYNIRGAIIIGLIIFTFIYMYSKRFQKFGVGFIPFFLMVVFYALLFLNTNIIVDSEKHRSELTSFVQTNNDYVKISVRLSNRSYKLKVSPEIVPVDSVDVFVLKGIFGLRAITDSATIQIENCPHINPILSKMTSLELARFYINKRCLYQAVEQYNDHLHINSKDQTALYERASTLLALKNHAQALEDFHALKLLIKNFPEEGGLQRQLIDNIDLLIVSLRIEYCERKLKGC
ncbi:MAG: hypothetical protein JJU02_01085 [Cryomorphaceae bacterium]|nr:hypothetical protein [Cryomorphaceae bacterium]